MRSKVIGLGKLMRLEKPIGTLLLLWPTLSSFFILKNGSPTIELVIIFCIGTFLMRSAGCVINDYWDRDFDGKVQRTLSRPLVTGQVTPGEALILFVFLISLSAFLLTWTNKLTFYLAFGGFLVTCFYPLTKRFFKIPQIFLGFAFSWGILMVSTAELEKISALSLIIFSACFCWIVAYDSAYAMSDKEDDLTIGLLSSAITFGKFTPKVILIFHLLSLGLWTLCGYIENLNKFFYLSICICLILVYSQFQLVKDCNREKCFLAFKRNNWIGAIIFLGSVLATVY